MATSLLRKSLKKLKRLGNVTPLVSVEGNEIVSDERRGQLQVYNRTMAGLQNCLDAGLLTGVCTSVCQTNYEDLVSEEWIDNLIDLGVMYGWYHIYRPVGPEASPELALTPEQQTNVRKFVVETRARKPIVMIDAYHDGEGNALCPAATGFTHHISPWGDIEPCPIIQFASESIYDERPLKQVFNDSEFLKRLPESCRGKYSRLHSPRTPRFIKRSSRTTWCARHHDPQRSIGGTRRNGNSPFTI